MIAQRLVQAHRLQERGVEPRQQLGCHDDNLQRIFGIAEMVKQLFFRTSVALVVCILIFAAVDRHDDVRCLNLNTGRLCRFDFLNRVNF